MRTQLRTSIDGHPGGSAFLVTRGSGPQVSESAEDESLLALAAEAVAGLA